MKQAWGYLTGLPAAVKAFGLLGTGIAAGVLLVIQATELPARVASLEAAHASIEADSLPQRIARVEALIPLVEYLACRPAREDEGKDPESCVEKIMGLEDYLRRFAQ